MGALRRRSLTSKSAPPPGAVETHRQTLLELTYKATPGFASSSSPTAKTPFRTPLAADSSRGSKSLDHVRARRGTIALPHQVIDLALNGPTGSRSKNSGSETLWFLIEGIFAAGDATPTPSSDGSTSPEGRLQRQHF